MSRDDLKRTVGSDIVDFHPLTSHRPPRSYDRVTVSHAMKDGHMVQPAQFFHDKAILAGLLGMRNTGLLMDYLEDSTVVALTSQWTSHWRDHWGIRPSNKAATVRFETIVLMTCDMAETQHYSSFRKFAELPLMHRIGGEEVSALYPEDKTNYQRAAYITVFYIYGLIRYDVENCNAQVFKDSRELGSLSNNAGIVNEDRSKITVDFDDIFRAYTVLRIGREFSEFRRSRPVKIDRAIVPRYYDASMASRPAVQSVGLASPVTSHKDTGSEDPADIGPEDEEDTEVEDEEHSWADGEPNTIMPDENHNPTPHGEAEPHHTMSNQGGFQQVTYALPPGGAAARYDTRSYLPVSQQPYAGTPQFQPPMTGLPPTMPGTQPPIPGSWPSIPVSQPAQASTPSGEAWQTFSGTAVPQGVSNSISNGYYQPQPGIENLADAQGATLTTGGGYSALPMGGGAMQQSQSSYLPVPQGNGYAPLPMAGEAVQQSRSSYLPVSQAGSSFTSNGDARLQIGNGSLADAHGFPLITDGTYPALSTGGEAVQQNYPSHLPVPQGTSRFTSNGDVSPRFGNGGFANAQGFTTNGEYSPLPMGGEAVPQSHSLYLPVPQGGSAFNANGYTQYGVGSIGFAQGTTSATGGGENPAWSMGGEDGQQTNYLDMPVPLGGSNLNSNANTQPQNGVGSSAYAQGNQLTTYGEAPQQHSQPVVPEQLEDDEFAWMYGDMEWLFATGNTSQ